MMRNKIILLVEDNPDDVELTIRAFNKNNISNKVIVAKDGAEALDYLFGRGVYQERTINDLPILIMLDLKLPKVRRIGSAQGHQTKRTHQTTAGCYSYFFQSGGGRGCQL